MAEVRVVDAATGAVVVERLRPALTHWARLRGLLGTSSLEPGSGLWLKPCRQIHMFGMRYAVDAVFLDDDGRIVRTIGNLAPNTVSSRVAEASSVLELPAGTIEQVGLQTGTQLLISGEAQLADSRWERAGSLACNAAIAVLYGFFAAAHLSFARSTGQWSTTLPLVVQELLLVGLFLSRRRSLAVSPEPSDWVLGIVGTFLPLTLRATDAPGGWPTIGAGLQIVGLTWAIAATASLGRSIGVVAGNRGVKTAGLYRVVRHPMYTGYLLSYAGYLFAYPTWRNLCIALFTLVALDLRARAEERFLRRDAAYATYLGRVPWRLLPRVY